MIKLLIKEKTVFEKLIEEQSENEKKIFELLLIVRFSILIKIAPIPSRNFKLNDALEHLSTIILFTITELEELKEKGLWLLKCVLSRKTLLRSK